MDDLGFLSEPLRALGEWLEWPGSKRSSSHPQHGPALEPEFGTWQCSKADKKHRKLAEEKTI